MWFLLTLLRHLIPWTALLFGIYWRSLVYHITCSMLWYPFNKGMRASVVSNGESLEHFGVTNGTKQGCVMTPFLFTLFFSVILNMHLQMLILEWSFSFAQQVGYSTIKQKHSTSQDNHQGFPICRWCSTGCYLPRGSSTTCWSVFCFI